MPNFIVFIPIHAFIYSMSLFGLLSLLCPTLWK